MKIAATLTLVLSIAGILLGLIPCLGWLNWFAVPFCIVPFTLGVIGLLTDKDPATGLNRASGVYVACVIAGVAGAAIGGVRCMLGGGAL